MAFPRLIRTARCKRPLPYLSLIPVFRPFSSRAALRTPSYPPSVANVADDDITRLAAGRRRPLTLNDLVK